MRKALRLVLVSLISASALVALALTFANVLFGDGPKGPLVSVLPSLDPDDPARPFADVLLGKDLGDPAVQALLDRLYTEGWQIRIGYFPAFPWIADPGPAGSIRWVVQPSLKPPILALEVWAGPALPEEMAPPPPLPPVPASPSVARIRDQRQRYADGRLTPEEQAMLRWFGVLALFDEKTGVAFVNATDPPAPDWPRPDQIWLAARWVPEADPDWEAKLWWPSARGLSGAEYVAKVRRIPPPPIPFVPMRAFVLSIQETDAGREATIATASRWISLHAGRIRPRSPASMREVLP